MKKNRWYSHSLQILNISLVSVLCWQVGIGLPIAEAMQSLPVQKSLALSDNEKVSGKQLSSELLTGFKNGVLEANPLMTDFVRPNPLPGDLLPKFDPSQKDLDEDPFFLRSQSWSNQIGLNEKSGWSFLSEKNGMLVAHSSWSHSLRIDHSLVPLIETGDYILFSVPTGSQLIESKVESEEETSEGLFYLSKRDLISAYQNAEARTFSRESMGAPVFFFPLPGSGWKGSLDVLEWMATNEVVLRNAEDKTLLPIEIKDLDILAKIQRMNLMIGQAITLYDTLDERRAEAYQEGANSSELNPFVLPLPSPKSTRAFGLFLSGKTPQFGDGKSANTTGARLIDLMKGAFLQEARADGFLESIQSLITPDIWQRIHILNGLLFGSFVGAVGLKYSVYRELFKDKYPNVSGTVREKFTTELKGVMDVYTHMLVTVTYTTGMSIVTSLEYLIDRFMTKSAGPKNGLLRKAFNSTMGWARAQSSKLATNWRTFVLGALLMGGIDSALVVVQLLIVTPFLLDWMGWQTAGAASATAVGTTAVAAFVTSEILQNFYSYFKTGAFSYSADQKFLVMDQVRHLVDRELIRLGKDPTSHEVQTERSAKIKDLLNKKMAQMGLPTDKEFLFDHNTVIEKVAQGMGYGLSKDELKILTDEVVMQTSRWGLAIPTLKRAYHQAVEVQKTSPSEEGEKTVLLLKEALNRFGMTEGSIRGLIKKLVESRKKSYAQLELPLTDEVSQEDRRKSFFKNPTAYIKALGQKISRATVQPSRDIRKTVSLMSYSGSAEVAMDLLPKGWIDMAGSKKVALLGAQLLRNSFLSITQGDDGILQPKAKTLAKFSSEAEEVLKFRETKENLEMDPFSRQIAKNEEVKRLFLEDQKTKKVGSYKPAKKSWFERLQMKRARSLAEQEASLTMPGQLKLTEDDEKYRKSYVKELARLSSLYLIDSEDSEFTRKVEEKALESMESQLNLPEEKSYIAGLDEGDRRAYEAQVFSEHFFDNYTQMSVLTDEHLKADALEQPGRFQWIRQKLVGKPGYEKIYRRVFRFADALYEDTVFQPGLVNYLSRTIPFAPEMTKIFVRNLRLLPYFATFGYFTNYYIWQIRMDYAVWIFYFMVAFYAPVAVAINNRWMKNFGLKPMGDWWSKAKYTFAHSWMTYPTFIPIMAFADPVVGWWAKNITAPTMTLIESCQKLLTGG